jgi:hypothetical protein
MASGLSFNNKADLDATLARVSAKPNVSGALVLSNESGAIIRSTLADNELAKKYTLAVKRCIVVGAGLTAGLLKSSREVTREIDQEVCFQISGADGRMSYDYLDCGLRNTNC